eukprot:1684901-Rhodomonas_salina.1
MSLQLCNSDPGTWAPALQAYDNSLGRAPKDFKAAIAGPILPRNLFQVSKLQQNCAKFPSRNLCQYGNLCQIFDQ